MKNQSKKPKEIKRVKINYKEKYLQLKKTADLHFNSEVAISLRPEEITYLGNLVGNELWDIEEDLAGVDLDLKKGTPTFQFISRKQEIASEIYKKLTFEK
jgi:hypothetical protein